MFVISDDDMGDRGSEHGKHEQAASIEGKVDRHLGEEEWKDNPNPTDQF